MDQPHTFAELVAVLDGSVADLQAGRVVDAASVDAEALRLIQQAERRDRIQEEAVAPPG